MSSVRVQAMLPCWRPWRVVVSRLHLQSLTMPGARNGWAIPWQPILPLRWACWRLGNRVQRRARVLLDARHRRRPPSPSPPSPSSTVDPIRLVGKRRVTCALVWLNQDCLFPPCPVFGTGSAVVVLHVPTACTLRCWRHLGLYHPGQKCGVKLDKRHRLAGRVPAVARRPLRRRGPASWSQRFTVSTAGARVMHRVIPAAHSHGAPDLHAGQLCDPADLCICQRAGSPGGRGYRLPLTDPVTLGVFWHAAGPGELASLA